MSAITDDRQQGTRASLKGVPSLRVIVAETWAFQTQLRIPLEWGLGLGGSVNQPKKAANVALDPVAPMLVVRPGGWASDDISSTYPPRLACLPLLRDWGYHLPVLASSLSTAIGAWSHPQAHVKRPSQIFLPAQQCLFAHQTPLLARQTVGSADSTSNVFQPRASLVVRGRKACRAFKQGRPQGTKNMKQTYVIRAASRWQSYY